MEEQSLQNKTWMFWNQYVFRNKHDLMTLRQIGQPEFERWVEYYTLHNCSVMPLKRQRFLLTFTEKKSKQKSVSEIEKDTNRVLEKEGSICYQNGNATQ